MVSSSQPTSTPTHGFNAQPFDVQKPALSYSPYNSTHGMPSPYMFQGASSPAPSASSADVSISGNSASFTEEVQGNSTVDSGVHSLTEVNGFSSSSPYHQSKSTDFEGIPASSLPPILSPNLPKTSRPIIEGSTCSSTTNSASPFHDIAWNSSDYQSLSPFCFGNNDDLQASNDARSSLATNSHKNVNVSTSVNASSNPFGQSKENVPLWVEAL